MSRARVFGFCALLFAAAGCGTGSWNKDGARTLPALDPGKGRVFVYRSGTMGSAYAPEALLNGEALGKFRQAGVVARDVPPGSYALATTTSATVVNFALRAGETKYFWLTGGFFDQHLHPELVDPAKGAADVAGLGPPTYRR